jgi:hypothetical protein
MQAVGFVSVGVRLWSDLRGDNRRLRPPSACGPSGVAGLHLVEGALFSIDQASGDPFQLLFSRRYLTFKNRWSIWVRSPDVFLKKPVDPFEQFAQLDHFAFVHRRCQPTSTSAAEYRWSTPSSHSQTLTVLISPLSFLIRTAPTIARKFFRTSTRGYNPREWPVGDNPQFANLKTVEA